MSLENFIDIVEEHSLSYEYPIWRFDQGEVAIIISVPEILVSESNAFNPRTKADWEKTIQTLPSRHAVVKSTYGDGIPPRTSCLRVVNVADSLPEKDPKLLAFIQRARKANSQSSEEITATERWREEQYDLLTASTQSSDAAGAAPTQNKDTPKTTSTTTKVVPRPNPPVLPKVTPPTKKVQAVESPAKKTPTKPKQAAAEEDGSI